MPKHTQVITIEITPERFLENCSDDELKELDLLIQSERYQSRIREKEIGFKQIKNTFTLKLGSNSFELTEGQSPRGLRIGTQRPDKIIVKVNKEMDKLELSKHIEYLHILYTQMQ